MYTLRSHTEDLSPAQYHPQECYKDNSPGARGIGCQEVEPVSRHKQVLHGVASGVAYGMKTSKTATV